MSSHQLQYKAWSQQPVGMLLIRPALMRLRSKARPRPGGKTAPLRKRSLPQGLPSPTHPLEDLYEAQGLQQHTNVHLQAKHPGRHQSSLQQPQTPSPGPPAPRLPLLEPVALLHPTPPHPTNYVTLEAAPSSYLILGWPCPYYLILGWPCPLLCHTGVHQSQIRGKVQLCGVVAAAMEAFVSRWGILLGEAVQEESQEGTASAIL